MAATSGYEIVRVADIPWEDRRNVDNWPSRAGMYYDDRENNLCMRLIDYPLGSVEPRHVHGGSHATTVLKGRAIVDGLTLKPLDVILGPSNEPHGPLDYPDGCKLLSVFHGSYHHSEVQKLSGESLYKLIQSEQIPWKKGEAQGSEEKTLVDRGVGRLVLRLLRFPHGGTLAGKDYPTLRAALLVEGSARVSGETLGTWDFLRVSAPRLETVELSTGTTLLAAALA
jgi:quercetin dioxygenase-like cupin family protein